VPNYYDILGVSPEASQADIRTSFRNLALKHHPDKNKNSEESKQKFMKIIEAYEVLSDEQARKNYDSNSRQKRGARARWTPSADFGTVYSYEEIKRRYRPNSVGGGMWDISDKASFGIWKATMLLFACLAALLIYIMILN
jgi:DnaJ-class molecular chaperone